MLDEGGVCVGTGSNSIGLFIAFLFVTFDITGVDHYGYGDQFMD